MDHHQEADADGNGQRVSLDGFDHGEQFSVRPDAGHHRAIKQLVYISAMAGAPIRFPDPGSLLDQLIPPPAPHRGHLLQ